MTQFNFDISFADFASLEGIKKLDQAFLCFLADTDQELCNNLLFYRDSSKNLSIEYALDSEFIIKLAHIVDDFIAELFSIAEENLALRVNHTKFNIIYECRRKFVQRYALKQYPPEKLKKLDFANISICLKKLLNSDKITEQKIAQIYIDLSQNQDENSKNIIELLAQYCAFMVNHNSSLMLFDVPRPNRENNHIREYKIHQLKESTYLGFNYRDKQQSIQKAYAHAKYCIYCHKQQKDSCRTGIKDSLEKNGCPLKQKISEMNLLKSQGFNIAALAVVMIDNPMVAATGHRICNDCMKACIYQKQESVNIPLIESNILDQVLEMPWGVEIYSLLTNWNPLNIDKPFPSCPSGYNILVTGLGPAGFALSYYLLREGHNIFAIDGLKITQLHFDVNKPVKFWCDIKLPLSEKLPQGFGGVAEYGITNRWDKNNLTLIRLILERKRHFTMQGGIRLGSNITVNQAFTIGFDHIALCLGAGKPKLETLIGYTAKGVRSSTDFLMNLQQGGGFLKYSNTNLLVRMPAVIIGCGLTAIDSAVELMHYYPEQVKKFTASYPKMDKTLLTLEELEIAQEFITHAALFEAANTDEEKLKILQNIGGVTICYRKSIVDSSAYKLNPEEIEHAIAIGVQFKENITPKQIYIDQFGWIKQVEFIEGEVINAKSLLIAIGVETNEFQDISICQIDESDIFKSQDKKISYFGDCNPKYAGSVVKAIASAKNGYKEINAALSSAKPASSGIKLNLKCVIEQVNILTEKMVEVVVYSPYAVKNFQPGQFFKLQNYSNSVQKIMKPLALTGAYIDQEKNTISLIILEKGYSSKLCKELKVGEEIILMGPTGQPLALPYNKTVALIGAGVGNVFLISAAKNLRENNCKIIHFAGYQSQDDVVYSGKIEASADQVFWICEQSKLKNNRKHDVSVHGNIIAGLSYAKKMGACQNIEYVICIGSQEMLRAVRQQKNDLFGNVPMICNIDSPMQCMMKGICGQCVQKVNDDRAYIFSCICQNQEASVIDFESLQNRLTQNALLEKLRNYGL